MVTVSDECAGSGGTDPAAGSGDDDGLGCVHVLHS
jgi:hypothetical protein